jgi:hypothetical protein
MDKTFRIAIIVGIIIASISLGYYFLVFQPQLAVNSCLVRAKKDFVTAKATACKEEYETGQNLFKRCLEMGLSAGVCDVGMEVWPFSPSAGCDILPNRMTPIQKDYDDAVGQCKNLSIVKIQ